MDNEEKDINFCEAGKKVPFNVPVGYFEQVEAQLLQIPVKRKVSTKIMDIVKPIIYVAAGFLLIMLAGKVIIGKNPGEKLNTEKLSVPKIDDIDFIYYQVSDYSINSFIIDNYQESN